MELEIATQVYMVSFYIRSASFQKKVLQGLSRSQSCKWLFRNTVLASYPMMDS
jgi:hypothetical protein